MGNYGVNGKPKVFSLGQNNLIYSTEEKGHLLNI